jgi:hypothetical protein
MLVGPPTSLWPAVSARGPEPRTLTAPVTVG